MFCTECGAKIEDGKKFCTECGAAAYLKPDFEAQTEYRLETFAQGPDPAPDPSQPLPVQERPASESQPQPQQPPQSEPVTAQASVPQNQTEAFQSKHQQAAAQQASAQQAQAQQAAAQQAQAQQPKPKSKRGCLVVALIVVAIFVLLSVSCSALSLCSSGSHSTGGSGNNTGAAASAQAPTYSNSLASAASDSKDSWTVLFYLCGSNLETEGGLATYNLQELTGTNLADNVTFVIETGGSTQWQNSTVSANYLTRYSYSSEGFYQEEQLPTASMAAEDTFSDFVSWGVKNFPADHYMLVLWDHGGGSVFGVCNDELFPYTSSYESDTLTLKEMTAGLERAGVKFDVIGFDTCLMATLETAEHLAPYANYLVASEEVEPGTGWDWEAWPVWLSNHKGATGDQLGAEICDTYYEKCKEYKAADMATLSVVDLSKISALNSSFYNASTEIALALGDRKSLRALYYGSLEAMCFGGSQEYNMVDLGDLMLHTSDVVTEYYDDVVADVDKAVVYQVRGKSRSNARGLSVFYPLDTSYAPEFYSFLDIASNVPYAQFAAVMFGLYNKVDWDSYSSSVTPVEEPVVEEKIDIDYTEQVNKDGRLELQVTKGLDDIAQVSIELALFLPDERSIVYLGTDYDLSGDWDKGQFVDSFEGTWMAINGNWVCADLYEIGSDYNLYYIPALLNGEATQLIAKYDFNTQKYTVIASCPVIDESNLAPKEMRELVDGDVIEFQFAGYSFDTNDSLIFNMGTVVWSDSVKMDTVDLGDGDYLFRFVLKDVLGEDHQTDMYVMKYHDGMIETVTLSQYLIDIDFQM